MQLYFQRPAIRYQLFMEIEFEVRQASQQAR